MDEKVVEKEKVEVTYEQEMEVMTEYFDLIELAVGTTIEIIPIGRPCRCFGIYMLTENNQQHFLCNCASLKEVKCVIQAVSNFMLSEQFREHLADKFLSKPTDKDA